MSKNNLFLFWSFFFFFSFLLCVCFFCFLFNFIFRIEIIFKREKNHIRVYLCCLIEEPPFLSLFVALMHVLPLYRSIDVICYERSVCMNASKGNKHNNNDIISRNSLFCLFCYFILAFRHRSFICTGKWKVETFWIIWSPLHRIAAHHWMSLQINSFHQYS